MQLQASKKQNKKNISNRSLTIFESYLHRLSVQRLLGTQQDRFLQRSSRCYKVTQRQLHLLASHVKN